MRGKQALAVVLLVVVLVAVVGLAHGEGAAPKQTLFEFDYPFAKLGNTNVLHASFSEAPSAQFRSSLRNYTDLRAIMVSNPVSGPVWELDSTVGLLTFLQVFDARGLMRGQLPTQLGLLTDMLFLDFREGGLTGTIPSELGLLTNAYATHLSGNAVGGTIPTQWGRLTSLVGIQLSESELEGTIPSQLALCRGVLVADLANSRLGGSLPPELFNPATGWRGLQEITADKCRFEGALPSELGLSSTLDVFEVTANRLSGTLPSQLGRALTLLTLLLGANRLSGSIPSQLGALTNLEQLNLGNNQFVGTIPSEFARLSNLDWLHLSNNLLTGTVPLAVFAFALGQASIGSNHLEGRIPPNAAAVWFDNCDYSGLNDPSCDFDCPTCTAGHMQLVECGPAGQPPKCLAWWWLMGGLVGCLVVCMVVERNVFADNATLWQQAARATAATFAVLDLIVDYLFALNADHVVGVLSFVVWGTVLGLSFLAGLAGSLAQKLQHHPARFVGACALCAVNPPSLGLLIAANHAGVDEPTLERHKHRAAHTVLFLVLFETVFQGTLQLVSVVSGDTSAITVMSLCFSAFRALSMFTVSAVLVLAREPKEDQVSKRDAPEEPTRAKGGRGKRRLAIVFGCLLPALALFPQRTAPAAVVPAARVGGGTVAWNLVTPEHNLVNRSRREPKAIVRKDAFECPAADILFVSLPFVCGLGGPIAVLSFGSIMAEFDFAAVVAAHPPLFAVVLLSDQRLSSELGLLDELVLLQLDQVNQQLPSQTGQLSRLMLLAYSHATIQVSIPSQLGNAHALIDLSFNANNLVGSLPTELASLTALSFLSLDGNKGLVGTVPSQFGRLSNLWHLDLGESPLSGALPSEIGNCGAMRAVNLDGTQIDETLPSQIGLWRNLEKLQLCNSHIKGPLPTQLYSITTLTVLRMCSDFIDDTLATELGALTGLRYLYLHSPRLRGPVPTQVGRLTALVQLGLVLGNSAPGPIPTELGLLAVLEDLWLTGSRLSGPIPSQLGLLTSLTELDLGNNRLQGTIPWQLSRLTALKTAVVERNRLEGSLSPDFGAVWHERCHYSGIEDNRCRRDCDACPVGSFRLRSCDPWGFGQVCVPPYATLLFLACFASTQVVVTTRLGWAPRPSPKKLMRGVVVSVVSALHLLFDWAFASVVGGAMQGIAIAVLSLALLGRLILVASELLRLQRLQGAFISTKLPMVVLAVAVCVVDLFSLEPVFASGVGSVGRRVTRRVLVVLSLSDVPMLLLQIINATMDAGFVAVVALMCSVLSLAIASGHLRRVRAPPPKRPHINPTQSNLVDADDQLL